MTANALGAAATPSVGTTFVTLRGTRGSRRTTHDAVTPFHPSGNSF